MMIDFDYYKRFRDELNGIYSEIYKFAVIYLFVHGKEE
jgi:hypothetical protein